MEEVPNARETRDDYQQVECQGCGLSHFVNSKTGKVLGEVRPASVVLCDPALAITGLAFERIDFVARLCLLRNRLGARSIAVRADTLFDLRLHSEPFQPPQLAASFKRIALLQLI